MRHRWVATGILTMLCGSVMYAQGVHFGPELGIYNAKDGDDTRLMGGVALRFKLSPALGLEGSINYRQEEYGGGSVTVRTWPVMVTGLIYPIPIVYGALGAGWYNTSFEYNEGKPGLFGLGSDTRQEFGWHFGAGVELPMGRYSHLIGDVRYVFLNYDFKQFPGSSGLNSNFYVITVGVLFGI